MSNSNAPPPPQLPKPFRRGQALAADSLESMRANIAHVLNGMIKGGKGILVSNVGNSVVINQERSRAVNIKHPFKIFQTGENKIKFWFGTVNQQTPTIGENPLTEDIGESPEFTIETESGTTIVYLRVTIDESFAITTIDFIESATFVPDTITQGHFAIASIFMEDEKISSIFQPWITNGTYFYAGDSEHIFFL